MRYPINFHRTPVTMLLLGVMIAIELFFQLRPEIRINFYNEYIGILPAVWEGQVWRPFTTCLMHLSLLHAVFNLWWFAVFSSVLEPYFGWKRYLGLIVLLGYVSALSDFMIQGYFVKEVPGGAGLSGILYGLFGLLLVGRHYRNDFFEVCNHKVAQLLIAWFFICIFLTWVEIMPIANIAHGSGWFFGWLYGMAIFSQKDRKKWVAAAVILSLLVFATMVICPGNFFFESFKVRHMIWWQF